MRNILSSLLAIYLSDINTIYEKKKNLTFFYTFDVYILKWEPLLMEDYIVSNIWKILMQDEQMIIHSEIRFSRF